LGVDVSTTATKALLTDQAGKEIAVASTHYAFDTPRPLWCEQDPDLWWQAAVRSIREVLAKSEAKASQVAAVGLTGQMHGLVLLDGAGKPLRQVVSRHAGAGRGVRRTSA
jgi:xylulokinase